MTIAPRAELIRLLRQRYMDMGDTLTRQAAEEIEAIEHLERIIDDIAASARPSSIEANCVLVRRDLIGKLCARRKLGEIP